jgi:hypothetical protein
LTVGVSTVVYVRVNIGFLGVVGLVLRVYYKKHFIHSYELSGSNGLDI